MTNPVPDAARRTDPRGFVVSGLTALLRGGVPAIAALIGTGTLAMGLLVIVPAAVALLGFSFGVAWLKWRRLTYATGADNIRVEHGLLSRHARAVPYDRIQDVSLEQKLIPRLFGLAEVRFETGAGGKDEITLAYLSLPEADRLRELVRDRKAGVQGEAAAPPVEAEAAAPLLFAMDNRRVLTFGLFEFSLVIFAVLLGAAQQFEFLLPFEVWDWKAWRAFGAAHQHDLDFLAASAQAVAIVAAVAGVLAVAALGVLTGVVRTFVREYGFRLERTDKGFRRRRGLFTRTDVVMPVARVQAARVHTRLLRRRFGWHGLSFVSLASDAKSASHAVAPFARLDEIEPIAAEAGFALPRPETDWHRASPAYATDRAALLLVPGVVAIGAALLAGIPLLAVAIAALATLVALARLLAWRHAFHAVDGDMIMARRGWLAPSLDIGRQLKIQSVEIAQGPLARRRGYATVHFGVAGGALAFHGVATQDARRIARATIDQAASVDFSALPR
ncbi:PH domain-containing protein [Tsuneonella sp. HG222]